MKKFWLSLTIAYMGILMYASLTTQIDKLQFLVTDLFHVPAYAVLAFLLLKTLSKTQEHKNTGTHMLFPCAPVLLPVKRHCFAVRSFILAVAYGAIIEVLQGYTGRHPSWSDIGLNIAGAGGMMAWIKWRYASIRG